MSTLAVKKVKLGDNADLSKNFLIEVPAVADGTLTIKRENGTNVLSIDAAGKAVIPGVVGTVAQVGGIPTGQIVEQGSNANGGYVRFADGTQICCVSVPTATYAVTIPTGNVFRTGVNTVTWPAAFAVPPYAQSINCNAADGRVWGGVASSTETQGNWLAFAGLSIASVSERFSAIAIGRWF